MANIVVSVFPWGECGDEWCVDSGARTVTLLTPKSASATKRTAKIARAVDAAKKTGNFPYLQRSNGEMLPVYGPGGMLLAEIDRSAAGMFGTIAYGIHLTAYTIDEKHGLRMWIGRRAAHKQTWPGRLDSAAAGGLGAGETPLKGMAREAAEEASIPEDFMLKYAKEAGCVSGNFVTSDLSRHPAYEPYYQPVCAYVFEIELDPSTVLKPNDQEVDEFRLYSVDEVKTALTEGRFKPDNGVIFIDFLIRHGFITSENEPDYLDIYTRSRRHLGKYYRSH